MGQVLRFPPQRSMGFFEPIDLKSLAPIHNRIKPTIRQSIAWMFFEYDRSVRQCARIYKTNGVTEFDVERVIREFHRDCVSRALNTGRLRSDMERRAAA